MVSFHTHPSRVFEIAEHVPRGIPSHLDLMTNLRASLFYKEPALDLVVSTSGMCYYHCQEKLLNTILSIPEDKWEDVLEIVYHNIGGATFRATKEPDSFKAFQREIALVYEDTNNITCGFVVGMI